MDPKKSFEWENLVFLDLENGKIKCGVCQKECVRLISHMNSSTECSSGIDMKEFKIEFTKFKHRQRKAKQRQNQKSNDIEKLREDNRASKAKQR